MANIVQFENVGLRYDTGAETLSDISFTLRSGAFYFLTGASGAGSDHCAAVSAGGRPPTS